eukprot:TRINITY_DN15116_c0_g1_i1.p1 TRINITY_DN15116_c0_g1~~TRINITY_DN15116_c0_g1_i1.p1  ORF type:complete len:610 (-),score=114.84 TRINITY_DN15116_c0_g1_i1:143-1972(-)
MTQSEISRAVEDLKLAGNVAFNSQDFSTAIDLFNQGIVLDPKNHVLFSNRAAAYLGLGMFSRALTDATTATQLAPHWIRGWARKGSALLGLQQFQEAEVAFSQGLRVEPQSTQLRQGVLDARAGMKNKQDAEILAQEKVIAGHSAIENHSYAAAVQQYQAALHHKPQDAALHLYIATSQLELGQYDEAIQSCRTAIKICKGDKQMIARAESRIAMVYRRQELLDKALLHYRVSQRLWPSPDTSERVAEVLQQAENMADETLASHAKDRGMIRFQKAQYKHALIAYTDAIRYDFNNAVLFSNRAACNFNLGRFQDAVEDADECIARERGFIKGYTRKAASLCRLHEWEAAKQTYFDGLKVDPSNTTCTSGILSVDRTVHVMALCPNELWIEIFEQISGASLAVASRVSRRFGRIAALETLWRRKMIHEFGLQERVGKSWRQMYADVYGGWDFMSGSWSLHVSRLWFANEYHFTVKKGQIPHLTSQRVNILHRYFLVHHKRVICRYSGIHFQFPQMGELNLFVEPVEEERITGSVTPQFRDLCREHKILAFQAHRQNGEQWMCGYLIRPAYEEQCPYYNRIPYDYPDLNDVLFGEYHHEPCMLKSQDSRPY